MIISYLKPMQHKVRYAKEPDNPKLLSHFVNVQIRFAKKSGKDQAKYLEALFRVLLDTAADESLPSHWRSQCFDYTHKPLSEMWEYAENDDERWRVVKLYQELNVVGNYVVNSISNPIQI